jgi:hypothetical protein
MKKECAHTRKALPNYLRGHLFKLEQVRIERHLRSCVVCYSQYEALKRADETRKFLKDITPPEGVVQIVKEGVSGLAKLKKILYRPLWILSIVIVVAVVYYFLSKPRQLDTEIDNILKTTPSRTAQTPPAPPPPISRSAPVVPPVVQPAAVPVMDPLLVVITTDDDKAAVRRINDIMRGHGQLRKYKFTDMVREISGNLTVKELLTFFNRIDSSVGKVSYSRKRLEAFPSAQPIPFVMRLTIVQKAPEAHTPPEQPLKEPVEEKGPPPSITAPTSTTAN